MTISDTLQSGYSRLLSELVAVMGLVMNALAVSPEAAFVNSMYAQWVGLVLFGVGAITLSISYATYFAEEQDHFRPVVVIYGGLVLAAISSGTLASMVVTGRFNNLLAVLILSTFAVTYVGLWQRFTKLEEDEFWFSSWT